ncbi:PAS domain S-box protein [Pseudanabaena catenata USMAC16]|uniref:Circadian input-output histidine kinase CikA n=1 Tax=Pseudanabaena catenata USMAC16 TaxID=1855837 RepID=A0A9X4RIP8_9CYAN|nr:PAS domain S-box protein [Pseudanabaena catenata]MDG3495841.1 PAS domain S-box protein [Pseudanabaena catenata USMAC16]
MAKSIQIHQQVMAAISCESVRIAPETSVMKAIAMMDRVGASCLLITEPDTERLIGIFTERDVVRVSNQGYDLEQPMQMVMSYPVISLQESDCYDINDIVSLLQQHQIRHLPVLAGDRLVGLLSQDSLMALLLRELLPDVAIANPAEPVDIPAGQEVGAQQSQVPPNESDHDFNQEFLLNLNEELRQTLENLRISDEELKYQNMQLTIEQQKYQDLFDFAPDGYLVTNAAGSVLSANQAILQLLGVEREFIVGKPLVVFIDRADYSLFYDRIEAQLHSDRRQVWEISFCPRQGNPFLAEVIVGTIRDEYTQAIGLRWLIRDISDRRKFEAEARKNDRYSALISFASDAIFLADAKGNLIETNQKAVELLGYSREELMHMHMSQIHPPDALEAAKNHFKNVTQNDNAPKLESLVIRKDGSQIPVEITGSRIELDGEILAQGIFRDISDRKQMEMALQQEILRRTAIFNTSSDGIFILDRAGNLLESNDRFAQMLGYEPWEITNFNVVDWEAKLTPEEVRELFEKPILDKATLETLHRRKDGVIFPVEISARVMQWQGEYMYICIARDISDRKQMEMSLQQEILRRATIFNASSDGMLILDRAGNLMDSNDRFAQMLGYEPWEITNFNVADWEAQWTPEEVQELFESENTLLNEDTFETLHRRKDGSVFPVEISRRVMEWQGEHVFICISRDISDRKQIEMALQQEIQRRFAIFNTSLDGIHILDRDGNLLESNERFAQMLGYESSEITALNVADWEAKWTAEELREIFKDESFDENTFETLHRRKDGSIFPVEVSVRIMTWQGESIRVCISRDISDRKKSEQALQESQSFIQKIADASPNILYLYDIQEQRNIYTNREIYTTLGYSPEEIQAMGSNFVLNVMHPDDVQSILPQYYERVNAAQDGETIESEYRMRHANGEWHWIHSRDSVFSRDGNGRVKQTIGTAEDISDRKKAEQALQESQSFIQKIADASPNVLYLYDMEEQKIIYTNREVYQTLGYSPEEVLAMGVNFVLNLMHPDDLKLVPEHHNRIFAAQDGEIIETEYRLKHVNGEWHWFYVRDSVFSRDTNGRVKQTIGTAEDISDRKYLQQKQNRLTAILEASTDYISMSDANGKIFWKNAQLKRLCGINPHEDTLQFQISDCHPEWAASLVIREGLPHAIATGSWIGETALLNAEGEEIPVSQLILSHKSEQEEIEFFSFIMRDMRVRKEYEQQLERTNAELMRATRLKDEFLATMSHELRTPLNAILGMTEAMQEEIFGVVNDRQITALKTVERSSYHLLELINDILDVAKIEAGQIELSYTSTSIQQLCQSSLAFIKQQALQKHIQIDIQVPSYLPDVLLDERRIRQVLINLLNNAVKFTPEYGQVRLEVTRKEAKGEPDLQEYLRFVVIDTGIGIAPENIPKLFQPFIQIDSALNRKYTGTGLGLALVKQIVELHGGTVGLTSELGVGSSFAIEIPFVMSPQSLNVNVNVNVNVNAKVSTEGDELAPQHDRLHDGMHKYRQPLILIAEDNETNISMIDDYLEQKGYRLLIAKNGVETIAMTKAHQPDIILMDVQMPVMDGFETIKRLRDDPQFANMPIIALTALAMTGDRDRCLAAGANAYLSKPFKLKELTETIQKLIVLNR